MLSPSPETTSIDNTDKSNSKENTENTEQPTTHTDFITQTQTQTQTQAIHKTQTQTNTTTHPSASSNSGTFCGHRGRPRCQSITDSLGYVAETEKGSQLLTLTQKL